MLAALLALALVGCGGGASDEASESTDVNQLLEETFSGDKQIDSGKIDLAIALEAQGGTEPGSIRVDLSGPFQSEGEGKLPKVQLERSFEGGVQSFTAGVTSTGDQGFVNFQ